MSEKQISETERKSKVIQISGKVTQETKDLFDELRESGAYGTFGQFMEALLENYQNPIKINKGYEAEIKRLEKQVEELQGKLQEKEADNSAACDSINEEREKSKKLQTSFDELRSLYNEQGAEIERLKVENHRYDGHIAVPVDKLDMRCLEWLAERENKSRKRDDITPSVFFMYAVREMLIKGNKFAIDSVPDSVIAKFKSEIANGQ